MRLNVVIPCRNEKDNIKECVEAILNADLPNNCSIQVHIVDGMSDDGTIQVINQLSEQHSSVKLVENHLQLTPFAFNLGIHAGENVDYTQIVGARQILNKNYFIDAIETLEKDKSIWCVGGNVENTYLNEVAKIISRAMSTSFGMGLGNFRTLSKSGFTDTVGTPMYPNWVFEKIGLFDEALIRNQDDDFNYRVIKAGGKIFFNSEISLKYYVRGNLKGLWRQFFQYGYWKVYVNKKHKAVTTMRQLVPPLFVLYLILLASLPIFSMKLFLFATVPFSFYFLLNLVFSVKCSEKLSDFVQLLVIFPILHISYGLGYLKGMWHFLILNKKPSDKQKRMSR